MLLGTGFAISVHAMTLVGEPHAPPAAYAIWPLIASIAIKSVLSGTKYRIGKAIGSAALAADAWNDAVDIVSGLAALSAVGLTLYDPQRFLAADVYGGFAVGLIVIFTGLRVSRDTGLQLMDTMPNQHMMQTIRDVAQTVSGVEGVEKCFARKTGLQYHVDLHLEVDPDITVRSSHDIAERLRQRIRRDVDWVADALRARGAFAAQSPDERNVGRDASTVSSEGFPEAFTQQSILGANANLGSDQKEDQSRDLHGPPRPGAARGEQHPQHGCVNGMPDPTIRAGLRQLVILVQRGFKTPLLAEMARGGPSHHYRCRSQKHGGD